ncbi:MAG: UDP-GlcNAc3NAcA epimerase [Thermosipho sp. (in: thermotogales)]|nr:UDP-GlcNAc3NAcA epimerase [Thermosipho sp. (in: thermotogales)]MDN5325294.1 UDP-GlcNAc3NAcA epimerase [Thermosipho sp. (in: thermotogales)]
MSILPCCQKLEKEGISTGVYFVGDVMYDLYLMLQKSFKYDIYNKLNLKENDYILLTLHRDFNVDNKEKLEKILAELNKISKEKKIVFPIHPRTRKRINEFNLEKYLENLIVIEPIDFLNLMGLVKMAWKVITDSGGLQKEAYFAKKRAVVLMPDTNWRELIEENWNVLANENDLYEKTFEENNMNYPESMNGDGNAGKKIIDILLNQL